MIKAVQSFPSRTLSENKLTCDDGGTCCSPIFRLITKGLYQLGYLPGYSVKCNGILSPLIGSESLLTTFIYLSVNSPSSPIFFFLMNSVISNYEVNIHANACVYFNLNKQQFILRINIIRVT